MDDQVKESKVSRTETYQNEQVSEDPDVEQSLSRVATDPSKITGNTAEDNPVSTEGVSTECSPADAPGVQQVKPVDDPSTDKS